MNEWHREDAASESVYDVADVEKGCVIFCIIWAPNFKARFNKQG